MKKSLLSRGLVTALSLAPAAASANVLVNLDASSLPVGALATWPNTGTVTGDFVSAGSAQPTVGTTGLVKAVILNGSTTFMAGPGAPVGMTGANKARSIEAWVYNPTVEAEESIIAWSRRGGPDGSNVSFGFGNNATFGAVGHWGTYDVGWGTTPTAGQWHYLAYTYDGVAAKVYVDGLLSNTKVLGQTNLYYLDGQATPQPLKFVLGGQNNNASPFAPLGFNATLSLGKVRVHDVVLTGSQIASTYSTEVSSFDVPAIRAFTASTGTYLPGQAVTLTWDTFNASNVSIDHGIGTLTSSAGSMVIYPTGSPSTYVLTATKGAQTVTLQITLVYPTASTAPILTHRWSFNEASGTACLDSVGGASGNGTIINATTGGAASRVNSTGGATSPDRIRLAGGASGTSAYIDLPNSVMTGLTRVTFEGWMTLNGSQSWSRYFDLGTNSAGEISAPGGSFSGTEYMLISAQVGGTTTSRRVSMRDNNAENLIDVLNDAPGYFTQFHYAAVYDPVGNGGVSPQFRYYKNGTLLGSLNTAFRPQDMVFVNNWLGRSNFSGDANTSGDFNEFRIWNGSLAQAQIAASLAAGPDGTPPSPALNIEQFIASPGAIIYRGQSANLSYWVTDPQSTGATVSMDQGVTIPTPTSLLNYVTVSPTTTTTYTLTATGGALTRTAQLTITVVSAPPVASDMAVCTPAGAPLSIPLGGLDPDTPAASLTYAIVAAPGHGSLSGSGTSRTYTPAVGFSGTDTFTYKANDGATDSNVATVTVTVLPAVVALNNIALDGADILTSTGSGKFVGRLSPTGGNPAGSITWSFVAGTGSTHNSYFTIQNGQLMSTHDFSGDLGQVISIRVRGVDGGGAIIEKVLTMTVKAPDLHVKINELNYNPAENSLRAEFIELYNPFAVAVNIGGWQFTKGITYTFPPGTNIAPHGYLVVAEDPATILKLYNVTALGPWSGALSSDGDDIVLKDGAGNKIDEVNYGVTAPWPAPPNGDGPTLELINPNLDNDVGGHWRASTTTGGSLTLVPSMATGWKYFKGTTEASSPDPAAWRLQGFDDAGVGWLTGQAPIGLFKINSDVAATYLPEAGTVLNTQLTDMATLSGTVATMNYRTVFFRQSFSVPDVATLPRALLLRVMHNDSAIVWLNGVEVARFGFPPGSPVTVPYNTTATYENGTYPWSELVIQNPASILTNGTNVLAIQGIAKVPQLRSAQEDNASYNIVDFCVDASLGAVPWLSGTPGAANSVLAANGPPAIRQISHEPEAPHSWDPIIVRAKVSDDDGIGQVQLAYQICTPGNYLPSKIPYTPAQIYGNRIDWALNNIDAPLQDNPAFEAAGNWTTIPMSDNGTVKGDVAGDGVFSAVIPRQPNRTLVRYRILATSLPGGDTVRVPAADDSRLNFATYVYDGVPGYIGSAGETFSQAQLTTLPIYQWITNPSDFDHLIAYNAADQFPNTIELAVLRERKFFNFEGAMVYDGTVYDHTEVRLRGGNSRYGSFAPAPPSSVGKRHLRFKFPNGLPFVAKDEKGRKYARPWSQMLFNKMFGNKGNYDYGLPYEVGARLWRLEGLPMPDSHWVHFRVVRGASETPDAVNGDFYGMFQALEFPDGDFLKARGLADGNLYKMSDWQQNGELDERYQAKGWIDGSNVFHPAPDFAEDFDNIRYNAHQTASNAWMNNYIDINLFYGHKVVQEAIRHYDIFIEPTGRHRIKNLIWYFQPAAGTNNFGRLIHMPYDWDASFGPSFNAGQDVVGNAVFDYGIDIVDSPTWSPPKNSATNDTDRTLMRADYRNKVREFRDLVWYRTGAPNRGPLDDMLDDAVADIGNFWLADRARWPITGAQLENAGGAPWKSGDMKGFAFTGWSDTLATGPAVGAGGRAAYLDAISDAVDAASLPAKPTLSYSGAAGYPVDGLAFTTSAFSDPQGNATQAAIQWRIGEVAAPTATDERIYEVADLWRYENTAWNGSAVNQQVPATLLKTGHTYRARVRHKDATGLYSHWSDPVEFVTTGPDYAAVLSANLVVSEFMYKPAAPTATEAAMGWVESDFEFVELFNISSGLTLDLTNVRFTKGVDFDFAGSAVTSLEPGGYVLIVRNVAAFTSRHGAGKPIAGTWQAGQNLSNSGEEVKLSYGAGNAIRDFTYSDQAPWPSAADAGGISLVLINPSANPDHANPVNWRASYVSGGTPASKDTQSLPEWLVAHGYSSTDYLGDADRDGYNNCLTYAFGIDRHPFTLMNNLVTAGGTTFLNFSYVRRIGVEGTTFVPEVSIDMATWSANPAPDTIDIISIINNGDGTETVSGRLQCSELRQRYFFRIRVANTYH